MDIVIIGAGQAAASAAAKLRALGHEAPLTIIGNEQVAPYQRPPLSKAYLLGQIEAERLSLRKPEWWDEQRITLRLGETASAIDRQARFVQTDRGRVAYDALILATGASPRRLPAELGGTLPGVHVIRTLADIDALAPALQSGRRLVVIGGGYIGLEAAAVSRKLGLDVTLLEAAPRILARVAASQTADMIRALHLDHGTRIIESAAVQRITGTDHVRGVQLQDGTLLPADLVICGIGVLPETALAAQAGLTVENGIATDVFGRTSDPAIWAAGDCASLPLGPDRLRLESVGNAIDMAETVAENILGANRPYVPKPWFWSDQYDAKLQIAGLHSGHDRAVLRRGLGHSGSTWYFRAGKLVAVDALNDPRAYMVGKRLIDAGRSPTPQAVEGADDLKALMA